MRRILHSTTYLSNGLCTLTCKAGVLSQSDVSALAAGYPMTLYIPTRMQGTFGGGRAGRGQRGNGFGASGSGGGRGSGGGAKVDDKRRVIINKTGDGELSDLTQCMMRDDSKILTNIVKHIPPNGAISVKSLNAQLSPDVQEAISEKYNGLKGFLEQRKQLFVVKASPTDGVLYAAATPLAYQKLIAREKQRETMQEMLGLNRRGGFRGGRGGGGGNRGGGGRGGGGGGGRGGGGEQFSRGRGNGGGGFRGRGNGGGGRMGGETRSFGAQSRR